MKKDAKIYLIFTLLLVSSCRQPHPPPNFTLCVALEKSGIKNCVNNSLPEIKNGKDIQIQAGDMIMSPESFKSIMDWGIELRRDLITCENKK